MINRYGKELIHTKLKNNSNQLKKSNTKLINKIKLQKKIIPSGKNNTKLRENNAKLIENNIK